MFKKNRLILNLLILALISAGSVSVVCAMNIDGGAFPPQFID